MEVSDYYDLIAQHRKEVDKLQVEARDLAKIWNPLGNMGGFGFSGIFSWFKDIAMIIMMILLFVLFLYACFKLVVYMISRGTQTPDPAAANKVYFSHYYNHQEENVTMWRSKSRSWLKRGL